MQATVNWSPTLQSLIRGLKKIDVKNIEIAINDPQLSLSLSEKNAVIYKFIEKSKLTEDKKPREQWT
jgi:hypothetical protein